MHPNASLVLWIYIVLLFTGGLIGFFKADSKASLITAVCFAAILIICNSDLIFKKAVADMLSTLVLVTLMVFFAIRLTKTGEFMPNGLMSVLTLITLVVLHVFVH